MERSRRPENQVESSCPGGVCVVLYYKKKKRQLWGRDYILYLVRCHNSCGSTQQHILRIYNIYKTIYKARLLMCMVSCCELIKRWLLRCMPGARIQCKYRILCTTSTSHHTPLGRFSVVDISTAVGIVPLPRRSALEPSRRERSEAVSFGIGTLSVVEKSCLENRPRVCVIFTVVCGVNVSECQYKNRWCIHINI